MPTYYDKTGKQRDAAWLYATFGDVVINNAVPTPGTPIYRVVELREKEGPAALIARVLDQHGNPLAKVPVIRFWPGAPELPQWDPPPERWRSRGVVGRTNNDGDAGFGMGQGDYYDPATQQGASAIWLGAPGKHSDLITGLGMLTATNHVHIDTTFQLFDADDPGPGPGPGPGPTPTPDAFWSAIAQGLETIAAAIRSLDSEA